MGTKGWAVILGASSGFGAATALELARSGYDICGVHLDRRPTLPLAQAVENGVREAGVRAMFFNVNAADEQKRAEVLSALSEAATSDASGRGVSVLVHSLAFGTLRPFVTGGPESVVSPSQMTMTLDVMAHSLVYWARELFWQGLLRDGARIFAMTSAGSNHVLANYGAVSAAKAALEAHVRQLAVELGPHGIAVNAIRAGVTDTPALRKIPGHQSIVDRGYAKSVTGRITTVEDVAGTIAALCDARAGWVTGNVIAVDGGEELVG